MQPIIHAARSPITALALALTTVGLAGVIALRPPPTIVVMVPISTTTAPAPAPAPAPPPAPAPAMILAPYYADCYFNYCPHLVATSTGYAWSY